MKLIKPLLAGLSAATVTAVMAACSETPHSSADRAGPPSAAAAPAQPAPTRQTPAPTTAATPVALPAPAGPSAVVVDGCTVGVEVGDTLQFSVKDMTVSSSCKQFTLTLVHTGRLPVTAMGHNWVLVPEGTAQDIGMAGVAAGASKGYTPDDARILAATAMIGGGESTSVTFTLPATGRYTFVCTFPGHWAAMQGSFTVRSD